MRGVHAALLRGKSGEAYNLGGQNQTDGLTVAKTVLGALEKPDTLMQYVADRPGHDYRYALDIEKAGRELEWRPQVTFKEGIARVVAWYRDNRAWWEGHKAGQAAYFRAQYEGRGARP